jgi:hypothetical protein
MIKYNLIDCNFLMVKLDEWNIFFIKSGVLNWLI